MAGDQEQLQKELQEAREESRLLKEEKMRAAEREKNLEEELMTTKMNLVAEKKRCETKDIELRKRSTGSRKEGSLKWDMDARKVGEDFIYSPYNEIAGLPFRLGCKTEKSSNSKRFIIHLFCNDNSTSKSYSADVYFALSLPVFGWESIQRRLFTPSILSQDCYLDDDWNEEFNYLLAYNQDGHVTIYCKIKVISYYKNAIFDFSSADPQLSDVTLIVGGKPFHVNRMYIAHYAEYFKILFCSDFAEKKKDNIMLEDIKAEDFQAMLDVIYPQRAQVTAATVTGLLHVADFFDVHVVRMECIEFLKKSYYLTVAAKLQLSDEFRLSELQHHILGAMRNENDLRAVIDSAEFATFSDSLKIAIHEKHFKLACRMQHN